MSKSYDFVATANLPNPAADVDPDTQHAVRPSSSAPPMEWADTPAWRMETDIFQLWAAQESAAKPQ